MRTVVVIFASAIFFLYGCAPAWFAAGGIATLGGYVYIEGRVARDYPLKYANAWNAVNTALANQRISISTSTNEDGKGSIEAVRKDGKEVNITLKDKGQGVTSIAVRVGEIGDRYEGEKLHDEIASAAGVR